MLILDCDSRATALASVAAIYEVASESIEHFFLNFDIDEHYERTNPTHSGEQELRFVFEATFNCNPAQPDRVCWFHLTRVPRGTTFEEGLLPLSASLDRVWQSVLGAFYETRHEARLLAMRSDDFPCCRYGIKTEHSNLAGPNAMLVREAADHAVEIGNHDYLKLPEIMKDICDGYERIYGERLHEVLSSALIPTIVKFSSAKKRSHSCVESALYYLYLTARSKRFSINANTCFDGENEAIPAEDIVSVMKYE